ncbi:hypothetical protein MATL_G00201980 [Megalops atlanticus]|uniref:bis(5'-adenosyl)-triphosphatase n=1 Tax=Megalops atlanticus TaxID=7932 RepID=A0A9D3PJI5_MEGAT|nr:hypothetical protein MATL_G00201980 [Megalops atlanticus]
MHLILWEAFDFSVYSVECRDKAGNATASKNPTAPPPLLLVSFDGFRADYLKKYTFPNLQKFFSDGVLVDHLTNVFITKTFPNHYSLVTGLYAESHGILASFMYDPATKKRFAIENDTDPFWWNEATPIWVSAQNSGYKTASAMWPGTDIKIQNRTSTFFLKYDPLVTFQERVTNLTKWLTQDQSVKFATLYWEEPDRAGHTYGPDNVTEMGRVLREVDDNVGYLVDALSTAGLWDKINVIVTSDHGMVQCSQDRLILLDSCLDARNYTVVDFTPVAAIIPISNATRVYNALNNCHPHMKAYLKAGMPDRLHYKNNERIQPIMLVADEGWTIVQRGKLPRLGDHGYDNSLPSMHPFLAAHGPAFHKGKRFSTFNSVDRELHGPPQVIGIVIGAMMTLSTLTCLMIFLKNRAMASSRPFARLELQEDDDDDPLID